MPRPWDRYMNGAEHDVGIGGLGRPQRVLIDEIGKSSLIDVRLDDSRCAYVDAIRTGSIRAGENDAWIIAEPLEESLIGAEEVRLRSSPKLICERQD